MVERDRLELTRRGFLAGAGLTGLGLLAAACAPGALPGASTTPAAGGLAKTFTPATIKVGTISVFEIATWQYVGAQRGYFRDFGIDLEVQPLQSGNAILTGTQAGQIDLADGGAADPLAAIEKGAQLRIIGASRPGLSFVVYARPGINSLKDLEGKTVGAAAPGSFLNVLMLALFEKEGVDKDKVTFLNIGASPAVYQSVVAGRVDAGPSAVDFTAQAAADGVKPLLETWTMLPDFVRVVFYSTQQTIQAKGDELARTLAGMARSYQYIKNDASSKEPFVAACEEHFRTPRPVAEAGWEFLHNNDILSLDLNITERQIQYMQEIAVRVVGNQERILPYNQVVDTSVLRKAQEYLRA